MDYETYRTSYFVDPPPTPRFDYSGLQGLTLYFEAYNSAVDFYTEVFGPPAYVEGKDTKGWRLGDTWLTLLRGRGGRPRNVEVSVVMNSPAEARRLQTAFIRAGATGPDPADRLMYEPIHACPVTDPFGLDWMIFSPAE
ncbi:MAG: hypothetical protein R3300_15835 [Candidatus Promineifilaceae bacterium]|nr:hypothetical protein [Candidatus Promineifilaceae bacterium]